ncbi:virulence factor BrkB family protein [Aestuariibacter salexigens]|uniref:virulence factor BrkB family protein n=1 Tax=Aestuariibacter salexigens TaxID=226010 RepID=UPI00041FCBCC|nr:virulence factor BrkB family protein [Aestuariibacter salexigens]
MKQKITTAVQNWLTNFKNELPSPRLVLVTFLRRSKEDEIAITAGHLAYVSLLSLVPFIMVFFTMIQAFPAFAAVREDLESFIFDNFVPHSGEVMREYITQFVGNASEMGMVGILSLVVVALLLISNIDKTLNRIWRNKIERPMIYTLAIYWMVLTLGPLLIGSSVIVSSYLVALANFAEEYTPGLGTVFLKFVPFITAVLAFQLVYMLVPNKQVKTGHALYGALLATLLFELTKKAFAFYVSSFPSYQVIYGALAVIPILFVWVYLSWIVVLLGAEFTCTIEELMENKNEKPGADEAGFAVVEKAEDTSKHVDPHTKAG